MKKLLSMLLVLAALASVAFAQATPSLTTTAVGTASGLASGGLPGGLDTLAADYRADYTVKAGDTLKDISMAQYGDQRYWPMLYMTNKGVVANPELLEPGMVLKIYELPFDPKAPGALSVTVIVETYLQTYADYIAFGASWVDQRRWVLLQAQTFQSDFFAKNEARIDAADLAWYKAR